MNAVRKRNPRARRSMFAELDSLVQEELDAVLTGRDEPPRKEAPKTEPPGNGKSRGGSATSREIPSSPQTPPPLALMPASTEHAGAAPPVGNDGAEDPSEPDLRSLFDAKDLAAIERIAAELRDRPNAEWMLEAVHELLFAGRAEDHAGASAAPVEEAS